MNNYNTGIIDEFRTNGGKVGGRWEGRDLLLLTTTGAKSGRPHTTPLAYLREGDHIYVFGSKGGAPTHPAWYHNLVANPRVAVEIGTDKYDANARVLDRPERDEVYRRQVEQIPGFGDYERATTRVIPVVELIRAPSTSEAG